MRRLASDIAFLALATLSVLLSWRLGASIKQQEVLNEALARPSVGTLISPLQAITTTGDSLVVGDSDHGGPVEFLVFLSTTCEFCISSMPALTEIDREMQEMFGARLVAVSMDSTEATIRFLRDSQAALPTVSLPGRIVPRHFRVFAVPTLLAVDRQHEVLWARVGPLRSRAVQDSVLAVVARLYNTPQLEARE